MTAYDTAYLELALRLSLPLATFDSQLRKAAEVQGIELLGGDGLRSRPVTLIETVMQG